MRCNKCHGETVGDQLQCDGCFMEDHSYPVAPGLCPDPIPDDIQDELTQLRARVKELESNEDAWRIKEVNITCDNLKQEARIRELEEAMPTAQQMRNLSSAFDGGGMLGCARGAWAMADRIEKAMKR